MNSIKENKTQLPANFLSLLKESIGDKNSIILTDRLQNEKAVTSVRMNILKTHLHTDEIFSSNNIEKVAWASNGYYLAQRPRFTSDPFFHAGCYYVQEASGMYMDIVKESIEVEEPGFFDNDILALDLCAAPGGKSTHLLSVISENSLLVANEVIRSRATILADNIAKWGASNAIVTNNDPQNFEQINEFFQLVIVDAPCSGEGLFGKDINAISEWSLENVNLCAQRQRRILSDVWGSLREGGFMVYSTCTYNKFENDNNLSFIVDTLGGEIVDLKLPVDSGIIRTELGGAQFIPGLVRGEGQYLSIVRKNGDTSGLFSKYRLKEQKDSSKISVKELQRDFTFKLAGDLLKGYPKSLIKEINYIESNLKTILSGVALANIKGKDFIPHADFALWNKISLLDTYPFGINEVDVDLDTALKFLSKEALSLPSSPKGFLLIRYNGAPLGFVKNLGNRCNNLLPQARRILKLN